MGRKATGIHSTKKLNTMDNRITQKWNAQDIEKMRRVGWLNIPFFTEHAVAKFIGSDVEEGLVESVHSILLRRLGGKRPKKLRGLALVCGDMSGERYLFQSRLLTFSEVDGIDISEVPLNKAVENCAQYGFKFNPIIADANTFSLLESEYDLVVGNHGIHHIENLSGLFRQISKSLKPHGLLYANEYIGPNYLQVPLRNRILASLLINLLVYPLRKRYTHENHWKLMVRAFDPREGDPSEAVKSQEIIKQCAQHLNILKLYKYGGLNYPAFEGLGHHFSSSKSDKRLMHTFIFLEECLSKIRIIEPLFCYLVAARKDVQSGTSD